MNPKTEVNLRKLGTSEDRIAELMSGREYAITPDELLQKARSLYRVPDTLEVVDSDE